MMAVKIEGKGMFFMILIIMIIVLLASFGVFLNWVLGIDDGFLGVESFDVD